MSFQWATTTLFTSVSLGAKAVHDLNHYKINCYWLNRPFRSGFCEIENKFRINKREKKNKLKGKNFQFRKSAQSIPEVNYKIVDIAYFTSLLYNVYTFL